MRTAIALAAMLAAAPAQAAVVTYHWAGMTVTDCVVATPDSDVGQAFCAHDWTSTGPRFGGFIHIDGSHLPLVSTSWSLAYIVEDEPQAIRFDLGVLGMASDSGWREFSITTDANMNALSWSLRQHYTHPWVDPGFYMITTHAYLLGEWAPLELYAIDGVPVAPVPLPAAGWLLLAGLAWLGYQSRAGSQGNL